MFPRLPYEHTYRHHLMAMNMTLRLGDTAPDFEQDSSAGRNFDEILRVIDSLQLTAGYSVATPVNRKGGEEVIIVPSLQDPQLPKQKFPKGYRIVKSCLRHAPQPDLK